MGKYLPTYILGWFYIKSLHSGFVLTVQGGKHGANVITRKQQGWDRQLWKWNGKSIVSKLGYALDIQSGSPESGANVIAYTHHGGPNQQWRVEGNKIISELNNMCLDISGGSKEAGVNIITYPLQSVHRIDNQAWHIVYQ